MHRQFVMFSHQFFVGETGQSIIETGGLEAAAIGAYLLSAANYIGIFRLHTQVVASDLHTSVKNVEAAIAVFEQAGFVKFDRATSTFWIVNGARMQLHGKLKKDDNKVKQVRRDFAAINKKSPLRREFHAMYAADLWLEPLEADAVLAPVIATPAPVAVPIAALTPPPAPVVAPEPELEPEPEPAEGVQDIKQSLRCDADDADTGVEPGLEELARFNKPDARALSDYFQALKMLQGLREMCREHYPHTGDEVAKESAKRIKEARGPAKAADMLDMCMQADDLDLRDALAMVFGEAATASLSSDQ